MSLDGFKTQRTIDLEAELAQARRTLQQEGERSPDGSAAYALAAQAVQEIHQKLHLSYAHDREGP